MGHSMKGNKSQSRETNGGRSALLMFLMLSAAALPLAYAQAAAIQSQICSIISIISSVVGILAIFLFVVGALLYSLAHIFPAAGNLKGSAQGWGMGMIIGGIIGIVLYILSSFIIYRLASFSGNGSIPAITQVNCNSPAASSAPSGQQPTSTPVLSQINSTSKTSQQGAGGLYAINSKSTSIPLQAAGIPNCQYLGSQVANGDFGYGNYSGWVESGSGFASSPVNLSNANYEGDYYLGKWSGYSGAYFATTFSKATSESPGSLVSAPFLVTAPYLNFKLVSPYNPGIYLELLSSNSVLLTIHYNTTNGQGAYPLGTFANASIYLGSLMCRNASIAIVSQVAGSPGSDQFIAAGDFRLSNYSDSTPGIVENSTVS